MHEFGLKGRSVRGWAGLAILAASFAAAVPAAAVPAGEEADATLAPHPAKGRKWRIGYCETKTFINYASTLANLAWQMQEIGWLKGADGLVWTKEIKETRGMWDWLADHDLGPNVEFVKDAYWTFEGLKGEAVAKLGDEIVARLNKGDVDLLIAMGTDAGKAVANDKHKTPVLVFSTSNAVKAGIIKSVEDSGRDHLWAHMDPLRYKRQLEIFHDIFHFKRLGIAYEDSKGGRTFAAVDDVEAVAKERGFTVVRTFVKQPAGDMEAFYRDLLAAHRALAPQVDAYYFGLFIGIEAERMPELFQPLYDRKVPVFSQQGAEDVKFGALMSVARANFKGIGRFGAETIARVLNGTPPRKLNQVFENSPNIVVNLEVARQIGYQPTFDILLSADELFQTVERK